MTKIAELFQQIKELGKTDIQLATAVVKVKSVDWANKTMVATGISDDLDYFDVMLSFGSISRKPKVGKLALIGVIEGKSTENYLIEAEELEKVEIASGEFVFNDGASGGLVKVQPLVERMNAIENKLNQLLEKWNSFCSVYVSATGGAPVNLLGSTVENIDLTQVVTLENNKIKHG